MTEQTDIPIDPELPEDFDDTPNDERPELHQAWWFVPYLITGPRGYTLRCLDGGAWDRSTSHGQFPDLPAALRAARKLDQECQLYRQMKLKDALFLKWHKGAVIVDMSPDGKFSPRAMTPKDVKP